VSVAIILGTSGFIGSHVAEAFRGLPGLDVIGAGRGGRPARFTASWLDIDLLADDPAMLAARFRDLGPSVVVNCTGSTVGSAADFVRSNVLATAHLLDVIERCGAAARLVHIGSAAEYGRAEADQPVTESTCARPLSAYGVAKLAATQLVATATAAGRVDGVVLRVFNALGPRMPEHTLPGAALRRLTDAVAGSASRIEMGPLDSVRDFVDVRDIGTAVVAASTGPRPGASVINVGSGIARSSRDLVTALAAGLGFRGIIGEAAAGSSRSTDVTWLVADVALAARALQWRANHDLASSVRLMLEQRDDGAGGAGGPSPGR
jgi:nucleoside-diphosphate-sugar epimerase